MATPRLPDADGADAPTAGVLSDVDGGKVALLRLLRTKSQSQDRSKQPAANHGARGRPTAYHNGTEQPAANHGAREHLTTNQSAAEQLTANRIVPSAWSLGDSELPGRSTLRTPSSAEGAERNQAGQEVPRPSCWVDGLNRGQTGKSKVVCVSQRPPRLGGVSRQSIP